MANRENLNLVKDAIRRNIAESLSNIQAKGVIGNFYLTEKEFLIFKEKRQFIVKVTANAKSNYFGETLDITETFRSIDVDKRDINYGLLQNQSLISNTLRLAHVGSYDFVLKDNTNQEYTVKVSAIRDSN